MTEINRKAVRALAAKHADDSKETLLALWAGPMTPEMHEAVKRVARDKGIELPESHGLVAESGETASPQGAPEKLISLEELGAGAKAQADKKFAFGWSEGISLFVGVGLALGLWPSSKAIALFYGVVVAVVLYGILHFARRTWKELGESALEGTDTSLRGRKKRG